MNTEALVLVAAVAGVGVLHTIVPDHWVPITLIARQRGWSRSETAAVALKAGIGHVLSTLVLGLVVWIAGVAFATRFGHLVDTAASIALIGFGSWITISALREIRGVEHSHGHGHSHSHTHSHNFSHLTGGGAAMSYGMHGPELQRIVTDHGIIELSIFEAGMPPRFRLTGAEADMIRIETIREGGARQMFPMVARETYWESLEEIPEPHGFAVTVTVAHGGHAHTYRTAFAEHEHNHGEHGHAHGEGHGAEAASDALYAAMPGGVAVLTHVHAHRHGSGAAHTHLHDHDSASWHQVAAETDAEPLHTHQHKNSSRTALMLILGSSPMVEGIPAFFAAGRYGAGVILLMATIFAISTVVTYVLLSVYSAAGLQRVQIGAFERYGEVLSGALIALVGVAFWIWPVL